MKMVRRTRQRIVELLILLELAFVSNLFTSENNTVEINEEQAFSFNSCTVLSYTDRILNLHIEIVLNNQTSITLSFTPTKHFGI